MAAPSQPTKEPKPLSAEEQAIRSLSAEEFDALPDEVVFTGSPERAAYFERLIRQSAEEVADGQTEPLLPIP